MKNFILNEQIAYYRKAKGVTQEEMAQELGVTNQTISKWESSQCCPDIQLLPDIADYFDISIDELIGHTKNEHEFRENDIDCLTDDALALLKDCGKISTAMLQWHLKIGYLRAKSMIQSLEKRGLIKASGKWFYISNASAT